MLILSIVFFLSAFSISYFIKEYYAPQKTTERLSKQISLAIKDLDTEIENVYLKGNSTKKAFREFLNTSYNNAFSKKGIEILVYQKDSLKFWTSNIFAAPFIKDSENFTSDVVRSGSGYYLIKQRHINDLTIIALQLIRYNYQYSNDYLPSGFYKCFNAPSTAIISLQPDRYNVRGKDDKFLFSISYDQPFELSLWFQYLIFSLYLTSFLFLISAIFAAYRFIIRKFGKGRLLFLFFVLDVIILRAIQFHFQFPADLYHLNIFNPAYFASSTLLPSLGDFLINSMLGLQIVYFAFTHIYIFQVGKSASLNHRKWISAIFLLIIVLLYFMLEQTISGLVLNSNISFHFENLLSLPHISHTGVLILATLLLTYLFLFELAGKCLLKSKNSLLLLGLISLLGIIIYSCVSFLSDSFDLISTFFLIVLMGILFFHVKRKSLLKLEFGRVVTIAIVLSAMATYQVNKSELHREHERRKLLAIHLSDSRDNLAEYYFNESAKRIKSDKYLETSISEARSDTAYNEISRYIKEKYFSGYWDRFLIQITVCQKDKKLNIKPGNIVTGCEEYFDSKIAQFMQPVSVPGLYFLRQSVDAMYYLGKINLIGSNRDKSISGNIFIEISSNEIWKGLGYPELLTDSKNANSDNLSGYSYAFYYKGELVKNVGRYSFDIDNENITNYRMVNGFYKLNGYNHLIYKVNKDTMIVISKEEQRISDLISPFSYIFLLILVMILVIAVLNGSLIRWELGIYTFRLRLQVIMIAVIVVSSVILVTVSLLFINKLNKNKNNEILSEKVNSILVYFENRYSTLYSFEEVPKEELSDLLLELSNTYFTDVNIYNSEGFLLASSRDQIFKEGMISEQINPSAAHQLITEKKSLIIERENIGKYTFLSAYAPVRNIDNHLLGYLNLPYFAKQEEIRREISGLISAFANIYVIMILIAVILALLLSRYITKPLLHIGNQFSRLKIGDKNAKIKWTRKDEIGSLVNEYNRMIDEMERSAELLARSERESAWRQMARQVAHEIKNPLTPIKLSMQLLMRAWNDKAPDWDLRLKRFSQTLIMQIDTLSSIATEFSDFAQMPEPQIQQFDVIPLIQHSVALYRDQSDCTISFDSEVSECFIKADPNQILRVFNNLIKNALQAIPGDRQGDIKIKLEPIGANCEISFTDNGSGIPSESQTRIFSPNFTTKTAGMGLGLAMVKNIVDSTSGRIWFKTDPGNGTVFFVSFPLKD
jgi:signal transduction histidine kinase